MSPGYWTVKAGTWSSKSESQSTREMNAYMSTSDSLLSILTQHPGLKNPANWAVHSRQVFSIKTFPHILNYSPILSRQSLTDTFSPDNYRLFQAYN